MSVRETTWTVRFRDLGQPWVTVTAAFEVVTEDGWLFLKDGQQRTAFAAPADAVLCVTSEHQAGGAPASEQPAERM